MTAPRCDHAKIRMFITSLILLIAAHWKFRFVEGSRDRPWLLLDLVQSPHDEPSEHSLLVAANF